VTARDPFTALGLRPSPGLTDDDIRAAWRRIAAATHPDRADGGDPAAYRDASAAYTVLRTELEEERATINDQLAELAKTSQNDPAPELLDALPLLGDILATAPARLQAALYQAFSIELLYNTDMHQVTIWATITSTTPATLAAIINDSETPETATTTPPVSDLPQHPGAPRTRHDQETGLPGPPALPGRRPRCPAD